MLAAVVEPEQAQRKHAVDGGGGLGRTDADNRFTGGAAQQVAARIGRAEAVFQVHGGAHGVDFAAGIGASQGTLQQAHVVAARGIARGGRAAVGGGNQLQRLRLSLAHAAGEHPQALRAVLNLHHGANNVALVTP